MRRRLAAITIAAGAMVLTGCILPPPLPAAPLPSPSPTTATAPTTTSPQPVPTSSRPPEPAPTTAPTPSGPPLNEAECLRADELTAAIIERSSGYFDAMPEGAEPDWAAMEQTSADLRSMLAALRAELTHPTLISGVDEMVATIDPIDASIAERNDLAITFDQVTFTLAAIGIVGPCQEFLS